VVAVVVLMDLGTVDMAVAVAVLVVLPIKQERLLLLGVIR
jgi:hypothetical protein